MLIQCFQCTDVPHTKPLMFIFQASWREMLRTKFKNLRRAEIHCPLKRTSCPADVTFDVAEYKRHLVHASLSVYLCLCIKVQVLFVSILGCTMFNPLFVAITYMQSIVDIYAHMTVFKNFCACVRCSVNSALLLEPKRMACGEGVKTVLSCMLHWSREW